MASKPASQLWLQAQPNQGGPGEYIIDVDIKEHFGRNLRSAVLTWSGDFVDDINREVLQEGKEEFALFDQETYSAPKIGGTISLKGTSNSKNLLFIVKTPDGAELDSAYLAKGLATGNGEEILGDPGRLDKFNFTINIKIPANNSGSDISRRIDVYGAPVEGPNIRPTFPLASCVVLSPVNDTYLKIDKTSIKIPATGGSTTIKVDSNTNWELKIVN